MTFWDFIDKQMGKGILWILIIILLFVIGWIVSHPTIIIEWNAHITTLIAAIVPKKRKKAFEKRINLTVGSARKKISEALPVAMQRFLPYDLKVEWVGEKDEISTLLHDKQIIVYVPSYKDEVKQAIGILHNYCSTGFALTAKTYMSSRTKDATDLIMTGKLAQSAGHHVYDYFNREYIPSVLAANSAFSVAYNNLKTIDIDGLFLPVYLNEIDKYAHALFLAPPSDISSDVITNFGNFLLRIIQKGKDEHVNLDFLEEGIQIKIVLAVSDVNFDIKPIISNVEEHISKCDINTVYILASGRKVQFANDIATTIYERNPQDLFEPIVTQYRRYTGRQLGVDSICYELNLR